MQYKKEGGIALVGILAIGVFVGLTAFLAWRVFNPSEQQANTAQPNSPTQQVQTDSNAGYVVIKEWGVRFKPTEGLNGVVYILNSQTSFTDDNATFTTQELAKYGDACAGKVNGHTPLGMLMRNKTPTEETPFTKHLGDYYYTYVTPQAACAEGQNAAADDLQTKTLNALFKPSITTLELAK